ncbi:general secretion pathway protein J [Halomonas campaniensis]|uniref:General secretion pathway protein J n=1 Tax=Halomonas campaniensis TaxID=213554 RepID=A0A7W5PB61_9GAMM|nr:prepilin-type N-terminal cleavage/methylation domain-containing protein [Halomonas campaniensis]MBB3330621.1 general secretion pathway protein J [Halomonas campaniensis]
MTSPTATRHERGFTLLEVLVALALTAMLGLAIASLVNRLIDAREALASPPAGLRDLHFSQLLERRLESLVVRPLHVRGRPLLNPPLDYRDNLQRLEWVSASGTPLSVDDHYTRVRRQRLSWYEEGRLRLASSGELDAAGEPGWQTVAELDGIEAVRLAFHDGSRWQSAPAGRPLPRGIRVEWVRHGQVTRLTAPLPEVRER